MVRRVENRTIESDGGVPWAATAPGDIPNADIVRRIHTVRRGTERIAKLTSSGDLFLMRDTPPIVAASGKADGCDGAEEVIDDGANRIRRLHLWCQWV